MNYLIEFVDSGEFAIVEADCEFDIEAEMEQYGIPREAYDVRETITDFEAIASGLDTF